MMKFTQQYILILVCSVIFTFFYNSIFFEKFLQAFPIHEGNMPFLIAITICLLFSFIIIFSLLASRFTTKAVLSLSFIAASLINYFMISYGTVIDYTMLQNALETDSGEASGLFNFSIFIRFLATGLAPGIVIWLIRIEYKSFREEFFCKIKIVLSIIVITLPILFLFSASFATFIREYKIVRYYVNPTFAYYSAFKLAKKSLNAPRGKEPIKKVSLDAKIKHHKPAASSNEDRELIILVVGETARADRFQLNGYTKETNPHLSKIEDIVSFSNVHSCGTSTAVSVPCMFLQSAKDEYESNQIKSHENVLDVLKRVGVNVLWLDNNSSSKGVADRVEYHHLTNEGKNKICDIECRDEGMLSDLQDYIDSHSEGDIFIILHSMGSHGPEYYKRYPESFEYFQPTCKSNKLALCSQLELDNAYDNTIRYTDYFLSKVIAFLEKNNDFETAMMYLSDHGESLGEAGTYLHGLPYFIAPESQTKVPAIIWTGENFDYASEELAKMKDFPLSHDNLYCTLLQMFEIETVDCRGIGTFLNN